MLSDHELGQVVHRRVIKANGIELKMGQLEGPVSQSLGDRFGIKDLQSGRDAEIIELVLAHH